MTDKIPEITDEQGVRSALLALITIDESIRKLERNRKILITTLGTNRGDAVEDVVDNVQSEIKATCASIPADLPEEDAIEWLRHALLDVIYNNT